MSTRARPLRADAERNRRLLLDVAAVAFAERGLETTMAEIARLAGVGQGTVFRRFASKEELVAAVVAERIGGLADRADAADGLRPFMEELVAGYLHDRGLHEALEGPALANEAVLAAQGRLLAALERLVARARDAGELRDDVDAFDVVFLVRGVGRAVAPVLAVSPELWRRYLAIVLDGLRPGGDPLPVAATTLEELERGCRAHARKCRNGD